MIVVETEILLRHSVVVDICIHSIYSMAIRLECDILCINVVCAFTECVHCCSYIYIVLNHIQL